MNKLIQHARFDQPTEVNSPINPETLPSVPGTPANDSVGKGSMNFDEYVRCPPGSATGHPLSLSTGTAAGTLAPSPLYGGILDAGGLPAQHAAPGSDEPQPIVARTSAGNLRGVMLPGAIYHRRVGYTFPQRRYAVLLDEPIAETECGAAIVEPQTGNIYGYIVQIVRYSRVQVAYTVAPADVLWDVSSRFDEEARHATLWYDKQRKALPPETASSPAYLLQEPPLMQTQASFDYGDTSDCGFGVSVATNHGLLQARPPTGPLALVMDVAGGRPYTARSGEKKGGEFQFVHYKGTDVDTERKHDTDCVGEQPHLQLPGGDMTDEDISITALLPDKKCPFRTCAYHKKGFARKHDLVRHVITHYDGQLYCGFCPDDLAKSFGRPFLRVEPLKRHLAVVHHAAKFRKSQNTTETYLKLRLKEYGPVHGGHCCLCSWQFPDAAKLYNHIEGCVVRLLLQRADADVDESHGRPDELQAALLG